MFCPKCGKRQLSDDIRFCAKCGLALEPARNSLTTGTGAIAQPNKIRGLSPKAKGILQGIAIIPGGIGVMAVIDIFYEALGAGMMAGLYSTLTMVVLAAIARILYAIFMEQGATPKGATTAPSQHDLPPVDSRLEMNAALSGAAGETGAPRSVTEHTTRQLHSDR